MCLLIACCLCLFGRNSPTNINLFGFIADHYTFKSQPMRMINTLIVKEGFAKPGVFNRITHRLKFVQYHI